MNRAKSHPKPKAAQVAYRALRSIKLGAGAEYAAGADLPLPASEKLLNDYQRLIEAGALQVLVDGLPYIERRTHFGPGTIPKIERFPL